MNKPIISIIAAMDEKRGIGKKNKLMWHIPGELARFKQITTGHPIIMGRKTFQSIGRILPNRTNIIITRDLHYKMEGAVVVHSLKEALKIASSMYHVASIEKKQEETMYNTNYIRHNTNEVFIIGGGQIFEQALPLTDKLYLTIVKGDFGADTFFPDYSEFKKIVSSEQKESGEYKYTFIELER